jgi:hypothetical protein
MWRQTPQQRVWLAKQCQAELFRLAADSRLAAATRGEPADHLAPRAIADPRTRLERGIALVRRTLASSDAPCNEPCPDIAFR